MPDIRCTRLSAVRSAVSSGPGPAARCGRPSRRRRAIDRRRRRTSTSIVGAGIEPPHDRQRARPGRRPRRARARRRRPSPAASAGTIASVVTSPVPTSSASARSIRLVERCGGAWLGAPASGRGSSSGKSRRRCAPRLSRRRSAAAAISAGDAAPGSTRAARPSQSQEPAQPLGVAHRAGAAPHPPAQLRQRRPGERPRRGAAPIGARGVRRRGRRRRRGGRRRSTRAASWRPAGWRRGRRCRRTRRRRTGRRSVVAPSQVGRDAAHQVVGGRSHRHRVAGAGRARRRRQPATRFGNRPRTAAAIQVARASGSSSRPPSSRALDRRARRRRAGPARRRGARRA